MMNEHKSLRLWKWAVLMLVLCNIGLIITIWVRPNLPYSLNQETPRDFVIRSLSLDAGQVKKYDALITLHRSAMNTLKKQSADYHRQLFDNLKNNNSNAITIDSLSQLIANNQKQIELVTYNHFAQVRALCTDAQKIIFDKVITDVTKMMARPPAGHRPPADMQGPPPGKDGPGGRPGPPEND